MSAAQDIIDILLAAGWTAEGAAVHDGRPHRPRFKKGDRRVTVGKRTTCFYRVRPRPEPKSKAGSAFRSKWETFDLCSLDTRTAVESIRAAAGEN